ncbi:11045_t:CDS:2 [Funneliformis mosseae]|uniref:11045_t:CDS:1 n=1 Tax=Funneliformis mosseae TaxID=27381 RepID=A0A9N9DVP1_FUNMO|nr:11045_t:CDS:2 [Funneliformis mosseae]
MNYDVTDLIIDVEDFARILSVMVSVLESCREHQERTQCLVTGCYDERRFLHCNLANPRGLFSAPKTFSMAWFYPKFLRMELSFN